MLVCVNGDCSMLAHLLSSVKYAPFAIPVMQQTNTTLFMLVMNTNENSPIANTAHAA